MTWLQKIKDVHPQPIHSQYGEESFIQFILHHIGTTNKYFVDIGANDGEWFSNTKHLKDAGWDGLMIDGKHENDSVHKYFVTRENIRPILNTHKVPKSFDVLSIDIDGNDYWVLDAILQEYHPRLIVSEYNSELPECESVAIKYDPAFVFNNDIYYGYSFLAGQKLAEKYGYKIVHQHSNLNLFYVDAALIPKEQINVSHKQFDWWKNPSNKQWVQI